MILLFIQFMFFITKCLNPLQCSDVTSQSDCTGIINGIYECMWNNNGCVEIKCEYIQPPCEGEIYQNTACSTSGVNCISVSQCSEIDNSNSCLKVKAGGNDCFWDTNCRIKTCQDNNEQECLQVNGNYCYFSNSICQEITQCSQITTQDLCNKINLSSLCQWQSDKCDNFSCNRITDAYICSQTVTTNDSCFIQTTNSNSTSVNCISCKDQNNQCDCEMYQMFGCVWKEQNCFRQSCSDYTDSISCISAYDKATCLWYTLSDQCVSYKKADQLDRECDLYVFGVMLIAINILIII